MFKKKEKFVLPMGKKSKDAMTADRNGVPS